MRAAGHAADKESGMPTRLHMADPDRLRAGIDCLHAVFRSVQAPAKLRAAWDEMLSDPHLPPERCLPFNPQRIESLPVMLAARLPKFCGTQWQSWADALHRAALDVSAELRPAVATLLYRALFPFEALVTWPAGVLFGDSEIALVDELSQTSEPATGAGFSWSPGRAIDYGGYVCAIIKVTRLCNLRCSYCHDWRDGPGQVMTFPVQAQLFAALMGDRSHETIDVVWHGGETTMIGQRRVLRMLYLQRFFARPGQTLKNRLQTNGTRLDLGWIRLLGRYDFGVGLSLDGPAEIHDRSRCDTTGGPTFAAATRGLRLLLEAGLLSHVYVVVTEEVIGLGAEAVLTFLQSQGIHFVGLLPERPHNRADAAAAKLARERYLLFLLELHRARQRASGPTVRIRELDALLRAAQRQFPGHCELLGNCLGHFFSIEPDGSVYHCDKYVGDQEFCVGNVARQTFADMRAAHALQTIRQQIAETVSGFSGCPHADVCQGWCPHEAYLSRLAGATDTGCCGLAPFFNALSAEGGQGDD